MKDKLRRWRQPLLFTLGGALLGLLYSYYGRCTGGVCRLSAQPVLTMAYMAVVGWLLSIVFTKKSPS